MSPALLSQAIRRALFVGAALSAIALPAQAQDSAAPATDKPAAEAAKDKATTLDRVEVTGTRIKRVETETSAPVLVITAEEVRSSGHTNIGEFIQDLTMSYNSSSRLANQGSAAPGEIHANLRNFGPTRTLVLINGRRWVGGTQRTATPDIGAIPTAAVQRIEVLLDGGSVLYGSDAMVGAINVILRDDYDGASANISYGQYDKGDGGTTSFDFLVGQSGERFSAMLGLDYTKYEPVFAGNRKITSEVVPGTEGLRDSETTLAGRYQVCYPTSGTGTVPVSPDGRCPTGGTLRQPDGATGFFTYDQGKSGRDWRMYGAATDKYNPTDEMYLSIPTERTSFFGTVRADITDHMRFKLTMQNARRESSEQLRGPTLELGGGGTAQAGQVFIPRTSYYNPFGNQVNGGSFYNNTGQDITFIRRQLLEAGSTRSLREAETRSARYQLEGDFSIGEKVFDWEAGVVDGKTTAVFQFPNRVRFSALKSALGPSFLDTLAGSATNGRVVCGTPDNPATSTVNERNVITGCVPLNLVGDQTATPAMVEYITFDATDHVGYSLKNYYADISSSDLFQLPGGPFGFALGVETRTESAYNYPDSLRVAGDQLGSSATRSTGRFSVDEAYLELLLPMLKDIPGIQQLDLTLAGRTSRYSNGVETTNGKFGFKWRVFDDLMVRGNYSQGFRSPPIATAYDSVTTTFTRDVFSVDPCSYTSAIAGSPASDRYTPLTDAQKAYCHSQGVPTGGYNTRGDAAGNPWSPAQVDTGGNPDARPETNVYKTLGLVYSPSYIEGLDLALDWYWAYFRDGLLGINSQFVLRDCVTADGQIGHSQPGESYFCKGIKRDPTTGVLNYVRSASIANVGTGSETEGYDLTVRYRLKDTPWGDFRFSWDTSYNALLRSAGAPSATGTFSGGAGGNSNARWRTRSNLGIGWSRNNLGVNWNMRYYSHLDEACGLRTTEFVYLCNKLGPVRFGGDTPQFSDDEFMAPQGTSNRWGGRGGENRIPSVVFHNANFWVKTPWEGRITIGVNNLFAKDPPVSYASGTVNSFSAMYDLPGRYYYMSYSQKF